MRIRSPPATRPPFFLSTHCLRLDFLCSSCGPKLFTFWPRPFLPLENSEPLLLGYGLTPVYFERFFSGLPPTSAAVFPESYDLVLLGLNMWFLPSSEPLALPMSTAIPVHIADGNQNIFPSGDFCVVRAANFVRSFTFPFFSSWSYQRFPTCCFFDSTPKTRPVSFCAGTENPLFECMLNQVSRGLTETPLPPLP